MIKRRNLEIGYLITMFLLVNAGSVQAGIITVGSGAGYDFGTVQAGIDAANDTDTVLVAPGEHVITEPITFRGKAITVRAEAGPDETTIRMGTAADPERASVVIFEKNETIESVLEGFTITGGRGHWVAAAQGWGGGGICFVNASSGTVRNCAIVQNRTNWGGGVCCAYDSSVTMSDCIISGNSSVGHGGGVYCVYDSSLSMTDCIVSGNSSEDAGGGVACWYGSLTLTRCAILNNTGGYYFGGGVYAGHGSATLTNCVIARNTVTSGGGGVACSYWNASLTISNCIIWGNSGGALYGGGGVLCREGSAIVTNSIIWGNTSAKGREISVQDPASTLTITYSNVAGGQAEVNVESGCTLDWGEGNIDADPYLADPDKDDYHLKSQAGRWNPNSQIWVQDNVTSPSIDAGDPMSPIGWECFPNGGFVNMGAYGGTPEASKTHFDQPICETIVAGDINGDGQVNRADLDIMALHWTDDEPLPLP